MALAPKLSLKQSQSLVMTPQLQQAIKLLQLSNIELAMFVEEQLESNPLLERGTGDENRREEAKIDKDGDVEFSEVSLENHGAAASDSLDAPDDAINGDDGYADRAMDVGGSVDWSKAGSGGTFSGSGDYDAIDHTAAEQTLSEVLHQQLAMGISNDTDRLIGAYLIDNVDDNGYLQMSAEEAAERLGVANRQILSVLTQLQTFEPTGVFARDLKECLALQLRENGDYDAPMQALIENIELLAKYDLSKLTQLCGVGKDALMDMMATIKSLSPKPGLAYGSSSAAVVEPDVFIRQTPNGGWAVELNSDTLPRVLVNQRYFSEISGQSSDEQAREFISECHQNANWLVKSLDQRARTILKVATEIVRQQDGFFAFGINHMRPLNLKTVADAIEMHESTVSRVTTNKFMATPRGNFEFKYFFSAAIPATGGGEEFSAEAVRSRIKILISEETAKTVLSDDKIVKKLRAEGIDIARRTVAKYRESLNIPSSVERRRQFKHDLR